jgi:hypothetical protein
MVAGFAEVAERKEILVVGVGFEPTTSGPADEIGRQENGSPSLGADEP